MGANYDGRTYFTDDKEVIRRKWDNDVQDSQHMDGCSYSGCIGMLTGHIDWVRIEPFNSEYEASEYISEHACKWDGPMAVPFKIKGTKAVPAYVKNAEEKCEKATKKIVELEKELASKALNSKSKFVGCKNCNSKLNKRYLRIAICPLCNKTLLSGTSLKRIEAAKERERKASKHLSAMRDKARATNATGKIGYTIGGICSS